MARPTFNITYKLIIYLFFLSIIPLVIVGATSYQTSSNVVLNEAYRYTKELVINQRNYLDLQLEQIESLITNLSGVQGIRDALEAPNPAGDTYSKLNTQANIGYILNGYSNLSGLVSIDIFTLNDIHYHVGDTLNATNIMKDVKDRIFAEALASNRSILWVGIEDNVNGNSAFKKVITAAKVLYTVNRETLTQDPIALMLVNYSVESFYQHFNSIQLGENAYLTLLDNKNRAIYHPDINQIGNPINPEIARLSNASDDTNNIKLDGVTYSVNFIKSHVSGWTVIGLIPIDTLMAKTFTILQTTIIILLGSFIAVAFVGWLFNRDVVVPIRQITWHFRQTEKREDDNLPEPVEVKGNDEIAELGRWYNTFIEVLDARQQTESQRLALALERERIEILGHFISEASHEFRTPLSIINTNAFLIRNTIQDDKLQGRIISIEQQVQHINDLVDSLTLMTKLDSNIEPFAFHRADLNSIIQIVQVNTIQKAQDKQLNIISNMSDTPTYLECDTQYLQYAVQCVWDNAIQYTPVGGTISISVYEEDTHLLIEISDNGNGIVQTDLDHIFKRFYRLDKAGTNRGFGLGLAITKVIIERHHGQINIVSEENQGTTVQINLPRSQPSST